MPNSKNYKQNINNPKLRPGQLIRRVVVDEQYVIKQKESGNNSYYYGLDLDREFIELHFYVPDTDRLVYSATIPLEEDFLYFAPPVYEQPNDVISLELDIWEEGPEAGNQTDSRGKLIRYSNSDSLQETYLKDLPSGTYDVIINFFADEIGTYNDINWRIKTISPSKTEIILHANPNPNFAQTSSLAEVVDLDAIVSRDYEQFLIQSIFYVDFESILSSVIENSITSIIDQLNNKQIEKSQLLQSQHSQTLLQLIDNVLDHTLYDINSWVNVETSGALPGGNRYRIQINRLFNHLSDALFNIIGEHEYSLTTNDSGAVPFIVNR